METTNQSDGHILPFSPNPQKPLRLLQVCPIHAPSPLVRIKDPSGEDVLVKDETGRMGLGSFKALGGVYAVAAMIGEALGKREITPEELVSPGTREFAGGMTFVCASAGNHGLAVAAGAQIFGAKTRIHLSSEVPPGFATRLRSKNAEVVTSGDTYEESLTAALQDTQSTGAILLADGSWPGYTHPPSLVMEGYTVIAEELRRAFIDNGDDNHWPTDVYLQAGVGGLAGAITHMIRKTWGAQPRVHVVEPEAAPCLAKSNLAGRPVRVEGPASNMARLDCKEPSIIAHAILARSDVEFITISDNEAAGAANYLASKGLPTTPSGAAGMAALIKQQDTLEMPKDFQPLIIVTETGL